MCVLGMNECVFTSVQTMLVGSVGHIMLGMYRYVGIHRRI